MPMFGLRGLARGARNFQPAVSPNPRASFSMTSMIFDLVCLLACLAALPYTRTTRSPRQIHPLYTKCRVSLSSGSFYYVLLQALQHTLPYPKALIKRMYRTCVTERECNHHISICLNTFIRFTVSYERALSCP